MWGGLPQSSKNRWELMLLLDGYRIHVGSENEILQMLKDQYDGKMLVWSPRIKERPKSQYSKPLSSPFYDLSNGEVIDKQILVSLKYKTKIIHYKLWGSFYATPSKEEEHITTSDFEVVMNTLHQFYIFQQLVQSAFHLACYTENHSRSTSISVYPDSIQPQLHIDFNYPTFHEQMTIGIDDSYSRTVVKDNSGTTLLIVDSDSDLTQILQRSCRARHFELNATEPVSRKKYRERALSAADMKEALTMSYFMSPSEITKELLDDHLGDLLTVMSTTETDETITILSETFSELTHRHDIFNIILSAIVGELNRGVKLPILKILYATLSLSKTNLTHFTTIHFITLLSSLLRGSQSQPHSEIPLPSVLIDNDDDFSESLRATSTRAESKKSCFMTLSADDESSFIRRQSRGFQRVVISTGTTPRNIRKSGSSTPSLVTSPNGSICGSQSASTCVSQNVSQTGSQCDEDSRVEMKREAKKAGRGMFSSCLWEVIGFGGLEGKGVGAEAVVLKKSSRFMIIKTVLELLKILLERAGRNEEVFYSIILPSVIDGAIAAGCERSENRRLYVEVLVMNNRRVDRLFLGGWSPSPLRRKKSDMLLWRVSNILQNLSPLQITDEIISIIALLADYITQTFTRTICVQTLETVVPQLLSFMSKLPRDADGLTFRAAREVLRCMNVLGRVCVYAPVATVLVTTVFEKGEISAYCTQMITKLFDKELIEKCGRLHLQKEFIQLRIELIKFYTTTVTLLAQTTPLNARQTPPFRALETLVLPPQGVFYIVLREDYFSSQPTLLSATLHFLSRVSSIDPQLPKRKSMVNEYIRMVYLLFIRCYSDANWSIQTRGLARRCLKLLIVFCANKSELSRQMLHSIGLGALLLSQVKHEFAAVFEKDESVESPKQLQPFESFKQSKEIQRIKSNGKPKVPRFSLPAVVQKTKRSEPTVDKKGLHKYHSSQDETNPLPISSSPYKLNKPPSQPKTGHTTLPEQQQLTQTTSKQPAKTDTTKSTTVGKQQKRIRKIPTLATVPKLSNFTTQSPQALPTESHGALTQIEQNLLQTGKLHRGVEQYEESQQRPPRRPSAIEYWKHRIYTSRSLHLTLIKAFFHLLIQENGMLDPLYCQQFPEQSGHSNILFILAMHLDNPHNSPIVNNLISDPTLSPPHRILLRLMVTSLFHPSIYRVSRVIGDGAYGVVYDATIAKRSLCSFDIFTEVSILTKFSNDPRACHLYDFGVADGHYWIVMKRYTCSLLAWRRALKNPTPRLLCLVFEKVLCCCGVLDRRVNHYDIKCDNIFLDAKGKKDDFLNSDGDANFEVCLGDFGEAIVYRNEKEGYSYRHRGTEAIKSPEMLALDFWGSVVKTGANRASDVWSIGCLFYELLTGNMLFQISDVAAFYSHMLSDIDVLPERVSKELPTIFVDFLNFVLVKDPAKRPSLSAVRAKFTEILALGKNVDWIVDPHIFGKEIFFNNSDFPEFMENPRDFTIPNEETEDIHFVEITPRISVSSKALITNNKIIKSKITHIVCVNVEVEANFKQCEVLTLSMERDVHKLLLLFQKFVDFARDALVDDGNICILSRTGEYALVMIVGYLMIQHKLPFYEAWIHISSRLPTTALSNYQSSLYWISSQLFEFLGDSKAEPSGCVFSSDCHFHCYCGDVSFTLKAMVDEKDVRLCQCTTENHSKGCPVKSCKQFLSEMKKIYNFSATSVVWSKTTINNVREDISAYKKVVTKVDGHENAPPVYRCKRCYFLTHCLLDNDHLLIVSNIKGNGIE
ncbi:hypothetical protein QTN25_007640 [Entamoeba marina]